MAVRPIDAARRFVLGAILTIASGIAGAVQYDITLFDGATGIGGFDFTNPRVAGAYALSSTNNPSVTATVPGRAQPLTFNVVPARNPVNVRVRAVDFNQTPPAPNTPNKITGAYVEGLTGRLLASNNFSIEFTFFTNGSTNPANFTKGFVIRNAGGRVVAGGRYGVANINTIPEPSTLAILALGLLALAAGTGRRFLRGGA